MHAPHVCTVSIHSSYDRNVDCPLPPCCAVYIPLTDKRHMVLKNCVAALIMNAPLLFLSQPDGRRKADMEIAKHTMQPACTVTRAARSAVDPGCGELAEGESACTFALEAVEGVEGDVECCMTCTTCSDGTLVQQDVSCEAATEDDGCPPPPPPGAACSSCYWCLM